ncbi:DNA (cytosine-5-)-methyltransferase [Microbispora triticiradicis]|nr:DNA (cytosine-5-)-methyltransferase [Microbispora triticiradicis]
MAVHRAGFRPLLFNEFAKRACETLVANGAVRVPEGETPWIPAPGDPWPLIEGDIKDVKFDYLNGKVDVLAGGPPCQPFSLGGVAKGDEDHRNMFPQMFRAIRQMRPKAVICENVRGLLRKSFEPYFNYILRELELPYVERKEGSTWQEHDAVLCERIEKDDVDSSCRYRVVVTPVNAADFGVPQVRHRVIIVAFRADLPDLEDRVARFEKLIEPQFSETALIHSIVNGDYWERHAEVPEKIRQQVLARLPKTLPAPDGKHPWRTLRDAIKGIKGLDGRDTELPPIPPEFLDRKEHRLGGFTDHIGWPDARIYSGHTPNELDRPAKTVKAGVHGVPGGESVVLLDDGSHRYMTVRETARVMTFPDYWQMQGPRGEKMRQLGNAVPVLLGEVFARAVSEALDGAE